MPRGGKREGAGRPKGAPNKVAEDLRAAASEHSHTALKTIVKHLNDPDPRVSLRAAQEILDRAHGKPVQSTELSNPDGTLAPLPTRIELVAKTDDDSTD